ncbi:hypothetical protein LguiB_010522 [Lonicera macranthoides]
MDLGNRGKPTSRSNGVVAGSVWESRMNEFKGGIKVFNAEQETTQENNTENVTTSTSSGVQQVYKRMRPKQSLVGVSGKRKTWKSESAEGFEKNPIQISKQRSELNKNLDQLSQSADGIRRSPVMIRKTRSEVGKEVSGSFDGIERSPVHSMRTRSKSQIGSSESSEGIVEKNLRELRRVKSELNRVCDESSDANKGLGDCGENVNGLVDGIEGDSVEIVKEKLEEIRNENFEGKDSFEENVQAIVGIEKNSIEEIGVCEEKVVTSNVNSKLEGGDEEDDDWEEELEKIEVEIEKKCVVDVKEISVQEEQNPKKVVKEENKIHERNEIPMPISEIKPKKVVIEERKIHQRSEKSVPISPVVRKLQPTVVNQPKINPKPTRKQSMPVSDGYQRVPRTHNKLQSLVDLVMWRDASKSAFVFGAGTFIIISSSYTRDLNISLISVVSYMGLVYLAAIFLFRSIICRGTINIDDTNHVVGEEEATWLLKLILPYINEFLLKLRALFSGDPATTMKLAVLLFVLARCGGSITIWKMAKLGFFGVFTVPKICSSYSTQLTAYGTFWIQRFRDAWESCAHKKAVAFAVFTLVWNLSSIVARIWAVFMLFVAFRYYQHSLLREENWAQEGEEETRGNENPTWQGPTSGPRQRRGPISVDSRKQKKGS